MKESFDFSFKKQSLQNYITPFLSGYKTVYTLLGPDIERKERFFKSKGVKNLISYEIDREVYLRQLRQTTGFAKIKFGNILQAPVDKDCYYDLDYCITIKSLLDHVSKFKEDGVFTFCLRGCGIHETANMFLKARGESLKIIPNLLPERNPDFLIYSFSSNAFRYRFYTYRDFHSPPMGVIKRI